MLTCSRFIVRSSNALLRSSRKYIHSSTMSAQDTPPLLQTENGTRKRQSQGGRPPKRQRTKKEKPVKEGSSQEVLLADVRELFAAQKLTEGPEEPGVGALEKDTNDS